MSKLNKEQEKAITDLVATQQTKKFLEKTLQNITTEMTKDDIDYFIYCSDKAVEVINKCMPSSVFNEKDRLDMMRFMMRAATEVYVAQKAGASKDEVELMMKDLKDRDFSEFKEGRYES